VTALSRVTISSAGLSCSRYWPWRSDPALYARNQAAPLSSTIDALDNLCLRRILNIHWSEFVTSRRLCFFGHLYCADSWQDHHRALQAGPPDNWRRRIGRPGQSWLRTVEADLQPMNLGLATAKRRAQV